MSFCSPGSSHGVGTYKDLLSPAFPRAQTAALPCLSPKKNTIQEKQVTLGFGETLVFLHQPLGRAPPRLPFLTPEPFLDPRGLTKSSSNIPPWPETKQEEQQLVLLIQQISVQPEFQRSLMKKRQLGSGLGGEPMKDRAT